MRHEIHEAARTIREAHRHLADKKMMKHVRKHVSGQAKNLAAFSKALEGGQIGQPGAPHEEPDGDEMSGGMYGPAFGP